MWLLGMVLACEGEPSVPEAAAPSWATAPAPPAPMTDAERLRFAASEGLRIAERFRKEIDCGASAWRSMCAVHQLPGSEVRLPDVPVARFGLMTSVRNSQPVPFAAERTMAVAVLRLEPGPAGVMAGVEMIPVTTESEPVLADIAGTIGGYAKGVFPDVTVTRPAAVLLTAARKQSPLITDADGLGFLGDHPTRLWRVENAPFERAFYVVWMDIEGGGFMGVFPDVDVKVIARPGDDPNLPVAPWPAQATIKEAPR